MRKDFWLNMTLSVCGIGLVILVHSFIQRQNQSEQRALSAEQRITALELKSSSTPQTRALPSQNANVTFTWLEPEGYKKPDNVRVETQGTHGVTEFPTWATLCEMHTSASRSGMWSCSISLPVGETIRFDIALVDPAASRFESPCWAIDACQRSCGGSRPGFGITVSNGLLNTYKIEGPFQEDACIMHGVFENKHLESYL